jgi:hypothetical protein
MCAPHTAVSVTCSFWIHYMYTAPSDNHTSICITHFLLFDWFNTDSIPFKSMSESSVSTIQTCRCLDSESETPLEAFKWSESDSESHPVWILSLKTIGYRFLSKAVKAVTRSRSPSPSGWFYLSYQKPFTLTLTLILFRKPQSRCLVGQLTQTMTP